MVIASIDLMKGKAVQLVEGKEKVLEREDPLLLARQFHPYGEIALIDLDAALGQGENPEVIKKICRFAQCRVGGGIRSVEQARQFISWGAQKVIVGSMAFENNRLNISFLTSLANAIGREKLIVAVDARHGKIMTHGWRENTGLDLLNTAAQLQPLVGELLFTCVQREGHMAGADLETIRRLRQRFAHRIVAAGGIQSLEEITALAKMEVDVQLGMALYTGKISLAESFTCSLHWKTNLIPVIAQDQDQQVLMMAYTNRDALQKTFETGNMWYYSRSKERLWQKGETSGHTQKLLQVRADCDRDTLLATVEQTGVACHLGSYSCFGPHRFDLPELYRTIARRFAQPEPGSYTATLDPHKVREKLLEEAQEVVEAQTPEHILWEAADLLYFLTVLMQKEGITYHDVLQELYRRRHSPRR